MAKQSFVDPNVQSLTPEQQQALIASRWGGDQTMAATPDAYARLMARDADGFQMNAGGGQHTGSDGEAGFTGEYTDYTRAGTTFSRKRDDGLFDSFDADGKYMSTSNDNNSFSTKDWVTFAAMVAGAYYATGGMAAGSAVGGTSAGAVDAAALGLDAAATTGGTAAGAVDAAALGLDGLASAGAAGAETVTIGGSTAAGGLGEFSVADLAMGNEMAGAASGIGATEAGAGGLITEAGKQVAKSTATDAAKDAIKGGASDAAKSTIIDAAKDTATDGVADYLGNAAKGVGKFVTDNKLAPTLLNMGAGIISRYADSRERARLDEAQRQRYQDGYKSGSGLSLWRSKINKSKVGG